MIRKVQNNTNPNERAKILKEINKITGKKFKSFTSCPMQKIVEDSIPELKPENGRKFVCRTNKAYCSVGSQTGAINEYEGIVRYPSTRRQEVKAKREVGLQVEGLSPSPREMMPSVPSNPVNHVKLNQIPTIKPKQIPHKPDPCKAPPTYQRGIIPKYLHKLKESEDVGSGDFRRRMSKTQFPEKISNVDEVERERKLKKLASWHDSYKRMVSELNMLNVTS